MFISKRTLLATALFTAPVTYADDDVNDAVNTDFEVIVAVRAVKRSVT